MKSFGTDGFSVVETLDAEIKTLDKIREAKRKATAVGQVPRDFSAIGSSPCARDVSISASV